MWPPISSSRISCAWPSASSGVSAKRTPPAFMRPPVRTWDLMTTGPPTASAASRAGTKRPRARRSRSSTRPSGRSGCAVGRSGGIAAVPRKAVGLGQLGVLLGEHLGERDHHLALLPGRVVLHLAVDHVDAASVRDRLEDLLREEHLVDRR